MSQKYFPQNNFRDKTINIFNNYFNLFFNYFSKHINI